MNDVSSSIFVRKIEQVNRTGAVADIDRNVADLAEAVGALVEAEELGNGCGSLGAEFSGRYVRGKRGCCSSVLEEGSVEMDKEKLEKHAVSC